MADNLSLNPTAANNVTDWPGPNWTRQTGQSVGDTGRTTCGRFSMGSAAWQNIGGAGGIAASSGTTGGRTFSYVAWVRSSVSRQYRHYFARYSAASSSSFVDTFGSATDITLSANTWTKIRGTATCPTGGSYVRIAIHSDLTASGSSGNLDIGAVRIVEGNVPNLEFADGDSPGWTWTGTAGNSTSEEQSEIPVAAGDDFDITDGATLQVTVDAADTTTVSETVAVGIPIDRADSIDVDDAAVADAEAGPQDAADVAEQVAFDASLGAADSATVTATPAMAADLNVTDTPLDVDDDIVIINVAEDDHDTDEDVHIDADLQVGDSWTLAEGSSVESLYADLAISVYIVDPDDQHLIPLPDFTELTLSPQRNSPGSITLRYPSTGLNFPVLRDNTIDSDRDVEIEIWTSGTALGARRGYLQEAAGDDVAESVEWTFTGGFAELRLSEAIVYPQPKTGVDDLGEEVKVARSTVTTAQWNQLVELGYTGRENDEEEAVYAPSLVVYAVRNGNDIPHLADPKRELKFNAVTPGELVGFIMDQARARGTLDDIALDFTSERDTAGNLWLKQITTKYSPGTGYNQILDKLVDLGLCEWAVAWDGTKRVLQLWIPEGRGQDRTVGLRPVVLRRGRNLTEAPRKWTVRDSATAVMAAGAEGIYVDETSLDAQSRRGRRIETAASGGNGLITEDAVEQYAETHLKSVTPGVMEVTHGLGFLTGEPRPVIAFDVGDWVYSQTTTALDRLRVVQWTLTVSEGRRPEGTVTLNDAVQDYLVRLNNRLNAITSGETVVGTSEDPAEQNTGTPNPPTGLVISSGAFNTGIDAYAVVNLGWAAPTTNTDNSALTDLSGFRVEWTEEANPDNWRFAADVGAQATVAQWTTAVGLPILYRVRAYNRRGVSSVWATGTTSHTTETDTDPPGVPSAPVGGGGLGLVDFRWDGLTEDDADMLQAYPDLKWVELHLSTSSLFTPDETTLADHIFGKGTYTYSQLPDGTALNYETTYFCRLVAVDRLDNRSDVSGQGSAIPGQVLSPDIFDGAVGSAKLADAAIVTAKIADLAVTDAKIQNLSVGKLTAGTLEASMILGTGKIATGTTGARTEIDSAGFRLYNSAGDMTVQLSSANGSAMITGEYRTALTTGLRLQFNTNGNNPDEIRFYPANTNQYGSMRTVTSQSPLYPNQAGLTIRAHSNRGDGYSGRLNVFPEYGSLEWGASYIQATENTVGFRAPRFHFGVIIGSPDPALRIGMASASTGEFTQRSVIEYRTWGNNQPALMVPGLCGLGFEHGGSPLRLGALNASMNGYVAFQCSELIESPSLRSAKRDFEEIDYEDGALGALRRAPVQKWRRIDEVRDHGDDAVVHIGAMVDDLPAEVVRGDPDSDKMGIAVDSLLGLVHAAVVQSADLNDDRHDELLSVLDQLTERIEQLEGN